MNAASGSPKPRSVTVNWQVAHRLLCACNLAYGVSAAGSPAGSFALTVPVLPSPEAIADMLAHSGLNPDALLTCQTDGVGIDAFLYGETDEAAVLAFRGTLPVRLAIERGRAAQIVTDWINNARAVLADGRRFGLPGAVHTGFAASLDALWQAPNGLQALLPRIARATARGRAFLITGHSKGGALACLAALRLANSGIKALLPDRVYTFAAPRTGDRELAQAFECTFPNRAWRFEFQDDIVPQLPPSGEDWSALQHTLRKLGSDEQGRTEAPPRPSLIAASTALNRISRYQSAGRLQFFAWDGSLIDEDTPALRAERFRRLVRALVVAVPTVSQAHLPMRGFGYMESILQRL